MLRDDQKPAEKTVPMTQADLESAVKSGSAADEEEESIEKTMTMSSDDLKSALARSGALEIEKPVKKSAAEEREESKLARCREKKPLPMSMTIAVAKTNGKAGCFHGNRIPRQRARIAATRKCRTDKSATNRQ
jgi:hypothetical protein